jgi:rhodanese-related sulfurtransferase
LSGFEILKGSNAKPPAVSPQGHEAAKKAAQQVAAKFGVACIGEATLARWQTESDTRTLYVFDVRDPAEYTAGHVPGMKNVPGGQLVQETDRHAAIWGARVVLVDDDGVRAIMTAHWMKQMGWDVAALTLDMRQHGQQKGPWVARTLGMDEARVPEVNANTLHQRLQAGNLNVVDVGWSRDYLDGHIPGAWYGLRSRLDEILSKLPANDAVAFTSSDGVLARLAAMDAQAAGRQTVLTLTGGTAAWRQAGYPLEQGATRMATAPDDVRLKAREQSENVEAAMQEYLSWEIELVNQMATDDDQRFTISARGLSTH